jgi:ACT domain-containing protein
VNEKYSIGAPNRTIELIEWSEQEAGANSLSDKDKILQVFEGIDSNIGPLAMRKILAVKLLPEARWWTVTRCCEAIGISRRTWYDYHKSDEFGEVCVALCKKLLPKEAAPVLKAFVRDALNGESKNQMAFLQQVGILDKARGDTTIINNQVDITVIEAERKKNIETGLARLGFATPETLHTES